MKGDYKQLSNPSVTFDYERVESSTISVNNEQHLTLTIDSHRQAEEEREWVMYQRYCNKEETMTATALVIERHQQCR